MKTYTFNGQQMTAPEIQKLVPVMSEASVRRHLKAGRNTTQLMMSFDPRAAWSRAGTKSAKGNRGWAYV